MNEEKMQELKKRLKRYERDLRCPIHKKLLGKYDARIGIINATYYCDKCHLEYTFTMAREV